MEKTNPMTPLRSLDPLVQEVLMFWFGAPDSFEYGQQRADWFQKSSLFDEIVRHRFSALYHQAKQGKWDSWRQNPESTLALLIILDQFSRHLYRGSPNAFATDAKALEIAASAIAQGFDQQVMPVARLFYYLPFEHSENILSQARAVELFTQLQQEDKKYAVFVDYAQQHYDIIAQFGRFPYRNEILGRVCTAAEQQYLSVFPEGF